MDYIIIIILIVILILVVITMFKNINEKDISERLTRLEVSMTKDMGEFKNDLNRNLTEDFTKLNDQLEKRLLMINEKVNERLDENFEKSNKTFMSILERLSRIDEAQKKIDNLSTDIISLQSVLTDKKTRGIYGEVNLNHILSSVFGERNDKIYKMQYKLSTGVIADCVLFAPKPLGTIAIDSKFPLEHYQKMTDKKMSMEIREENEKAFQMDMKKHIDAISSKYIIAGETTNQAILFLPAEAIFATINAYYPEIIEYSYKKRVWITSPTTLISTLTIIQMIIQNMEKDKYTKVIHEELNKLGLEFARYKERWDKLSRSIQTVNKDVENMSITTDKISKKFDTINHVDIESLKDDKKIGE